MPNDNKNLQRAKEAKNDEFYTLYSDIEKEVSHYKDQFFNKVVYCNCDDPSWSNFWKYFHLNFSELHLKKLISTHFEKDSSSYKFEYEGGSDTNINSGIRTNLNSNGDFRSEECINIINECDIICTNPPFSLFREFYSILLESKKDFLIIGTLSSITYKIVFPSFVENRVRRGFSRLNGFTTPDGSRADLNNTIWMTTLASNETRRRLPLKQSYYNNGLPREDFYKKLDGIDAINVDKIADIPFDYEGLMAVPVTIFEYDACDYTVIGGFFHGSNSVYDLSTPFVNGKELFKRIGIRLKK